MSYFKFINIGLVAIYAIGSGLWVNSGDSWYRSLNAPSWQPPDWVFGVVWPYNFTVLGIAGWMISNHLDKRWNLSWSVIFAITIMAALVWSYQFYTPHNLGIATIALITTSLFTLPLLLIAFKTSIYLGITLLPYQIWVSLASALSYNYWKLN